MTQVTLTNLVAKLSPELKRALEASAGAAMNQGVAAIEPEHWLLTLLNQQDTHLKTLIESQKINQDQLAGVGNLQEVGLFFRLSNGDVKSLESELSDPFDLSSEKGPSFQVGA